jgi:hypothetical protein
VQLRRLLASAQVEGLQVVVLVEHEVGAPVAVDEAAHVEDGGAREVAIAEHAFAGAREVFCFAAEWVNAAEVLYLEFVRPNKHASSEYLGRVYPLSSKAKDFAHARESS